MGTSQKWWAEWGKKAERCPKLYPDTATHTLESTFWNESLPHVIYLMLFTTCFATLRHLLACHRFEKNYLLHLHSHLSQHCDTYSLVITLKIITFFTCTRIFRNTATLTRLSSQHCDTQCLFQTASFLGSTRIVNPISHSLHTFDFRKFPKIELNKYSHWY